MARLASIYRYAVRSNPFCTVATQKVYTVTDYKTKFTFYMDMDMGHSPHSRSPRRVKP